MQASGQTEAEQLKVAIQDFFGFLPPFFLPAQSTPSVLLNLMQQTHSSYIKNPLPALFKEMLFAYLSRYCSVSYGIVCHSCTLYSLGMSASQVLALLEMPPLTEHELDQHLATLTAEYGEGAFWPQHNTDLEKSLLLVTIYLFAEPAKAKECRDALLRLVGPENFNYLLELLFYSKTCNFWIDNHPNLSYESDQRAQHYLAALLADEPSLADLFQHYRVTSMQTNSRRDKEIEELIQERTIAQTNELALRETNRRMDEFMGIASHELKTPLTTIKGYVQLVARRLKNNSKTLKKDDVQRQILNSAGELLERTDVQIGRLGRLVNELLDVSRIQANKLELHLEPCDVVTLVQEAVQDQQQEFPTRIILLVLPPEGTAPVFADVDRIGQVLSNYLSNALKYSPPEQPVEVRLQLEGKSVYVFVRDEGPGLSAEDLPHIWERFYRAQGIEVQSGSGVGLGLGLYICRTIIERHSGQVGVASTRGSGSTFWFSLPLATFTDTVK